MKYLLRIFLWPIYWLSGFFPRNPKIWVFGSHNNAFIDNSKYVFYYVVDNHKDIIAIWITGDKELVKKLRKKGYNALYRWSLKGFYACLRAKVYIYSAYVSDINWVTSRRAILFNLWHGIPLKKIEYDIKVGKLGKVYNSNWHIIYKIFTPAKFIKPHYFLSTTSLVSEIFAGAFRIKKEQCLEFGYPRCEHFFWEKEKLIEFIKNKEPQVLDLLDIIKKYKKAIIYLPTFREKGENNLKKIINFDDLNKKLKKQNILIIIKQHPNIKINMNENFSNILFLKSSIDVYLILPFTDMLITDYSSIFFDYALLNKPIIFFPYDKEEYLSSERGFYVEYDKMINKKSIVINFNELLVKIDEGFNITYNFEVINERNRFITKAYKESSKSIIEFIKGIL